MSSPQMLDERVDADAAADVSSHSAAAGPYPPRAVRSAILFIQVNLACDIRLPDIARAAAQSVSHFSRKFRKWTGQTPHRFLTQLRVERVQTLLLGSDQNLATIADEAGFVDQSHMSRVFRRHTGTTPGAFRRAAWSSSVARTFLAPGGNRR